MPFALDVAVDAAGGATDRFETADLPLHVFIVDTVVIEHVPVGAVAVLIGSSDAGDGAFGLPRRRRRSSGRTMLPIGRRLSCALISTWRLRPSISSKMTQRRSAISLASQRP